MKNHSFRDMEGYHKHLAECYRKRKASLSLEQLREVLDALDFKVDFWDAHAAHSGKISRVYLTSELAIKVRDRKSAQDSLYQFLANKIASDKLSSRVPVARVLAYDHFDRTDYEVLVMERAKGKLLIDDFIKLDKEVQIKLFGQMLDICNKSDRLTFKNWGSIKENDSYASFKDYIADKTKSYLDKIADKKIASVREVGIIKDYVLDRLSVFKEEKIPHFIHTDVNFANVLYEKDKVTLLYDFDSAIKGPRLMMLPMLMSSIEDMGEIVDGTKYHKMYRNKKFRHLYPILLEKMPDVFSDKQLSKKLNLILILRGLRLVAENRFERWNKVIIKDIIKNEIAVSKNLLEQTYYAQILKKMGV